MGQTRHAQPAGQLKAQTLQETAQYSIFTPRCLELNSSCWPDMLRHGQTRDEKPFYLDRVCELIRSDVLPADPVRGVRAGHPTRRPTRRGRSRARKDDRHLSGYPERYSWPGDDHRSAVRRSKWAYPSILHELLRLQYATSVSASVFISRQEIAGGSVAEREELPMKREADRTIRGRLNARRARHDTRGPLGPGRQVQPTPGDQMEACLRKGLRRLDPFVRTRSHHRVCQGLCPWKRRSATRAHLDAFHDGVAESIFPLAIQAGHVGPGTAGFRSWWSAILVAFDPAAALGTTRLRLEGPTGLVVELYCEIARRSPRRRSAPCCQAPPRGSRPPTLSRRRYPCAPQPHGRLHLPGCRS